MSVFAVLAGGGTAGHVLPALAVADALVARGHPRDSLHFVGAARGMEATMVPDAGYDITLLAVQGVRRSISPATARAAGRFGAALPGSMALLRRLRPQVVVSVGGYASVPPVLAAWALRIPVVVVSYDAVPGAAARMQSRLAAASAVAFATSPLPRREVTGAPLRSTHPRPRPGPGTRPARGRRWGCRPTASPCSWWAGRSARASSTTWSPPWPPRRPTGRTWPSATSSGSRHDPASFAPQEGPDGLWYQVVRYEDAMHLAYAASDLVLARAGATTVAELAAIGQPSILVPWPLATEDHQTANARVLSGAGGAVLVPDVELTPERLLAEVDRLRDDPALLASMGERARSVGVHDAADRIAALAERCARRPQ